MTFFIIESNLKSSIREVYNLCRYTAQHNIIFAESIKKQKSMQGNELTLFQKFGLAKTGNFNYSENVNAFIGNAFTSYAGNTYMNEIRLMEGLLIKEDLGQGYAYLFLNGIRIFDIKTKQLICEKNFHNTNYNQNYIKSEVKTMLLEILVSAARKDQININVSDVKDHIDMLADKAFNTDQRQMLTQQSQKYLTF